MSHRRVHLVIRGRVQGVSFRAYAQDEARRLGLSGFVRNLPGGEVESIAEGPAAQLAQFVAWCGKGSPEAVVDEVRQQFAEATAEFARFEVRR